MEQVPCTVVHFKLSQFTHKHNIIIKKKNQNLSPYEWNYKIMVMILLVILATQRSNIVCHQTYCPKATGWKKSVILIFFIFSSLCQRQCELLPSLVVRHLSSINFSHQVNDAGSGEPLVL